MITQYWANLVVMLLLGSIAHAQSSIDPSYSIHNYKHPNKSARAKQIQESKPEVYLQQTEIEEDGKDESCLVSEENYKCINPQKSRTKKFKLSNSDQAKPFHQETAVNTNYHQRFPVSQKKKNSIKKEGQKQTTVASN